MKVSKQSNFDNFETSTYMFESSIQMCENFKIIIFETNKSPSFEAYFQTIQEKIKKKQMTCLADKTNHPVERLNLNKVSLS